MSPVDHAFPLTLAWSDSRLPHHAATESASSLAMEYSALREHLRTCTDISRYGVVLRSTAQAVHRFFVTRFATTLVVLLLLMGLISLAL